MLVYQRANNIFQYKPILGYYPHLWNPSNCNLYPPANNVAMENPSENPRFQVWGPNQWMSRHYVYRRLTMLKSDVC